MSERILLLTNNAGAATSLFTLFSSEGESPFDILWLRSLADAFPYISDGKISAALLDLSLADSRGIKTLNSLSGQCPRLPVLVFAGLESDNDIGHETARAPYDYLPLLRLKKPALLQALHNIMDRKAATERLHAAHEYAQMTLDSIGNGVVATDLSGMVTYLNVVAEKMTGWRCDEATNRPLEEVLRLVDMTTRKEISGPMAMAMQKNKTVYLSQNRILVHRDGSETSIDDSAAPIHNHTGKVIGGVMVFHDVTHERAAVKKMSYSANYDYLTNLPNRMLLNDRITQAIEAAGRQGQKLAILYVDLDHLKQVNDTLGHSIGDRLLQSVSERLISCVRGSDTVSRHGGDEFVLLLSNVAGSSDGVECAQKILSVLALPHLIERHNLYVSGSIGISIFPEDGIDAEALISNADTAMYRAKASGRNNFTCFAPEMKKQILECQIIESALRGALERREFILHYQPRINLMTGAVTGVESLVRWIHPERGIIEPDQFIAIAEDCGIMISIGRWVLREACMQGKAWQDDGLAPLTVAVNISALEFRDRNFLDGVRAALESSGLPANFLELELTESVLMENAKTSNAILNALKSIGVKLAIDNFGTGYSSLSYLKQFPIDTLKIDRSFVQDLTTDTGAQTIVNAVIGMGENLRQRVVAEGIENRNQLAFLQGKNCIEGQGHYFASPMAAHAMTKMLRTWVATDVMREARISA